MTGCEVHPDFRKPSDHFRGICGVYFELMKNKMERRQRVTGWIWKQLGS